MINIRNIWKSFDGNQVHCGVSLDVPDKETMVIVGRSGGGKSVLLKEIIGLVKPDSGSIVVDSQEVTTMSYRQLQRLREKFGFLFQGAALFDSMTVGENVGLPLLYHMKTTKAEIRERVKRSLSVVGLENGVEDQMPASLSGGMRKRVGLARAVVMRPPYVLYDEPTTGLDMATADEINTLINDLKNKLGVTSIVVTHDIRSAFLVGDRFAVLHGGRVLMTGTADEIKNTTNEEVRQYIDSSLKGAEDA